MDKLFLAILNMSFTGAFVVAAICFARLLLAKAPKIISYCLWAVAWFRLAVPFSIESVFSLIPFKAQTISPDIVMQSAPRIDSGIPVVNNAVSSVLASQPTDAAVYINPFQVLTTIGSWVWIAGAVVMLVLGVVFYLRLKHKMGSAIRVEGNIYETDGIQSPFVLGVYKPKIYLPLDLSGQEREYIILHEQTHIKRYDNIIKFAAYFILCLHWFNPLAWAAFLLMGMDMEMSCDERVLKELGGELKKNYSMSLLSLAADRRVISGSAIAFGETGVKKRIKNVLKFRKSSRITVALAIVFVTLLSLGLASNRASTGDIYAMQTLGAETASIEADNSYVPDSQGSGDGANAGMTYNITDYYNTDDGKFSDLGLALNGESSERELTVKGGDILIDGDRRYEVMAESLTLSFYTQPSLDQVVQWWSDYLDSWAESGKVTAVS